MIRFYEKYTISRPTINLLILSSYEPNDLMYECIWNERDEFFKPVSFSTRIDRSLSKDSQSTLVEIYRRKDRYYCDMRHGDRWSYREYDKKNCELTIEQGIPLTSAVAMEGRKVGDVIAGIDALSKEKITSVRTDGNATRFSISPVWLRIEQVPTRRELGAPLFC